MDLAYNFFTKIDMPIEPNQPTNLLFLSSPIKELICML